MFLFTGDGFSHSSGFMEILCTPEKPVQRAALTTGEKPCSAQIFYLDLLLICCFYEKKKNLIPNLSKHAQGRNQDIYANL